jgi:hypothetical protein
MRRSPLSRADLRSSGLVIAKIYTINHPMIDHLFSKSSVSLSQRVILSVSTYAAVFGSGAFHQYALAPSHYVGMRKLTCYVRPPAPGNIPSTLCSIMSLRRELDLASRADGCSPSPSLITISAAWLRFLE